MELEKLSGLEIGKLVNQHEITAEEVIAYFVDRIEKRNPSLNAFVYTKIEEAFEEAQMLDHQIMNGQKVKPFAGVPIALKDFLPSKTGWKNSHGGVRSLVCEDTCDSVFYSAARLAGAIAVGKTNAPHFGFSGTCDNKLYGPTCNPFNVEYNSGGSSGGTAAAVADGMITFGEGGDAGGSIRIPSSWCNCFGFKASVGTLPNLCRPDAWAATHPFCCGGAITKTVEDSAVMLNYMAEYDRRDPYSSPINANKDFQELMKKPIKGMNIALTLDYDLFRTDSEIREVVAHAALKLEEAGANVMYTHFNFKHNASTFADMWCDMISIDTSFELRKYYPYLLSGHYADEVSEEFLYYNERASKLTVQDMMYYNELRTEILDAHEKVFDSYDIIISPVTVCNPVKNGTDGNTRGPKVFNGVALNPVIGFTETFLVNFIGYPAASVPAGFTDSGFPVGMQIIGKKFRDEDVLAVAHTFEQIQPWSYEKALNRM